MPEENDKLLTRIIPPPIGGLNKRDPLHAMPETDAITLDNWVPDNSDVRLRGGSSLFASITSGTHVVMLQAAYNNANNTEYLLASDANSNNVYQITNAAAVTSLTTSYNSEATFGYTHYGRVYIKSRDTADQYMYYDPNAGTLTASGITGYTYYYGMGSYRGALYFPKFGNVNRHPSFAYLNVGVVSGAALTDYDLSTFSREGGIVLFCGSTTRSKAYAEDQLFVAATSRGEVFVFSGEHPTIGTWNLIGIYKIPRPFSYKSFFYLGGHLFIWTVSGIISFADILSANQVQGRYNSLSDKIDPLWKDLATSTNLSFTNFATVNNRFAAVVNHKEGRLYMIAPDNYCYCKNLLVEDGGWFRVSGWPAYSIAVANDMTYIGSTNGRIIYVNDPAATGDYNPATGATDTIATEMQLAYNYLDKPTSRKNVTGVRVLSKFTDGLSITMDADMDYATSTPASITAESLGSGEQTHKTYCGLNGVGEAVSLHQKDSYAATKAAKINAFQIYYKEGDITP